MKEITEYIIVHGDTYKILSSAVDRGIKEGYQPFASPYICENQHFQALVMYKKDETNEKQFLNEGT